MRDAILRAIVFVFVFFSSAWAEDITFQATVDTTTVELGTSVQLMLTLNGTDQAPPQTIPKVDGLDIRLLGPSTQVSIVDGRMSRSSSMIFSVIPLRTGDFQIPAIVIHLQGKDYSTQPITLKVVSSGTLTPQGSAGANSSVSGLQDKIFIVMGTGKKEVYLNEPVPLTIKLFVNDLQVKNIQYPSFEHDGFNVDAFSEPKRYNQVLGGVAYHVIEFKTFIYPTRVGDLTIGPAKLDANLLIKSSRRKSDPFARFGGIFDDDAFDLLGAFDIKTITLESADLAIKVLPLPEAGKTADFSGAVGKYDFDMSVSPNQVKVGDPLTVRMKISGDGNLKAVNMPAYGESPDFKVYDPKITEENGSKNLEQVIIPNQERIKEVPAVHFNYFDPADNNYHTIIRGPFPVDIEPLGKDEGTKVVGLNPATQPVGIMPQPPESLGHDIRYIKETVSGLRVRGQRSYANPMFLICFGLLVVAWLALFLNYQTTLRLKTDVRFARRLQAPRQAKAGLARAKHFLDQRDPRHFYDSLFRTLQEYFGNKFHLSSGGVTVEAIAAMVPQDQKSQEALTKIRQLFEECELVRYASVGTQPEQMNSALRRAEEIIDWFERSYR